MKLIDNNGRLFGKISIVDVLVVLVVVAVGLAVYFKTHQPQTGTKIETETIVYQMLLNSQPQYVVDSLQIGDDVFDKERSTGGSLGKIIDIEVTEGTKREELDKGTVAMVPYTGRYNVLLTIEGTGLYSEESGYSLNRIYDIGVNSNRYFNTKYARFESTIVSIQEPQG